MNYEQKEKELLTEFNQMNIDLSNLDTNYKMQRDTLTKRISEVQGQFALIKEIKEEKANGDNPDASDKKK